MRTTIEEHPYSSAATRIHDGLCHWQETMRQSLHDLAGALTIPVTMSDAMRLSKDSVAPVLKHGTRYQVELALILLVVLPVLSVCYLFQSGILHLEEVSSVAIGVLSASGLTASVGLWMLIRYPKTVVRLRRHLQQIASGELPTHIVLEKDESDLAMIEECLNQIIKQTKKHVTLMEEQHKSLLEIERQDVMIQSLGAACHHIGQPLTVLAGFMDLIESDALPQSTHDKITACRQAVDKLHEVMSRLQMTSTYKTCAYVKKSYDDSDENEQILDIGL
jgi:signal transduction histidine kinase